MHTANNTERLVYSVSDACAALSIGRTSLYALINSGRLPIRKAGRRTLIPASAIRNLVDGVAQ
ncbi:Excisionase family DNA binding domain-containing protein [Novosphingobium resinovorum]|uniref:Excisionase family DNA binding domain-containing protein n=1 Tax=Novosphingobium resinovorum TaxID=158500 RepID=A0A031JRD2_9SPHN|nr:helix-turn-helix domain-containing protein [Novosphingobium resinovorum]EZP79515.1 Excisionase family DNA binding domain-containing protein [Novosphingobium resinovorum]